VKTRTRSIRTAPAKAFPRTAASDKTKPTRGLPNSGTGRAPARSGTSGYKPIQTTAASRRRFTVFLSLVGLLSLTSALLLALAPDPLAPGSAASLFALDQRGSSMDAVFDTGVPVAKGRWKSIFIHHSRTPSGNADTLASPIGGLADHFVIGNGSGCVDGGVQIGNRWSNQLPAGEVPGTRSIATDCVSICVVGDFDRTAPTPTQQLRLTQLVHTLQSRLGVGAAQVYLHQGTNTAADIGSAFPVAALREQLLP
jgi:hypothetical protein